jgi:hypothetical protein
MEDRSTALRSGDDGAHRHGIHDYNREREKRMATKKCESCDAEIGESEKSCPKCGVDFEELEDTVKTVDTATKVLEKRRKAEAMKCTCNPAPAEGKPHKESCPQFVKPPTPQKVNRLRGLGFAMRKRGA